jgi:pimeloyl-ACP methyl ester carboxylesterase
VAQYKHQFKALSRDHRVVAMDWRGHGRSDKPDGGYRVVRFAADLREFITGLGLSDVTFLAHSVGASVVWAYLDAYGTAGVKRLVFIDKGAAETAKPHWEPAVADVRGSSILALDGLRAFYETVLGSPNVPETAEMLRRLFSKDFPADELAWVAEENLRLPRPHAAALLWDIALDDWSDLFRRIELPVLVVGAEASLYSAASQRWIAAQFPNGRAEIFAADDGGSHFMFMENPARFNRVVLDFMASTEGTGSRSGD